MDETGVVTAARDHRRRLQAIAALAAAAAVLANGCAGHLRRATDGAALRTITVAGAASVSAAPDMAVAQIGVMTEALTADAATATNNELTAAVIAAIAARGVSLSDIETSSFNLQPRRDYDSRPKGAITGYHVSNVVRVTIRDLERVGSVLEVAIDAGANHIRGLHFSLQDQATLQERARQAAVAEARGRAASLAGAAGVELGQVRSIRESGGGHRPTAVKMQNAALADVPIQPGELDVSVQVEVVFEIR